MKKFWIIILLQLLVITISHGQSFQTIRGIIIEKNSGNPIPYATVVLLNSQPTIGTVTDSLGNFTLSKVPIGRHDLEVRCLALLKESLTVLPCEKPSAGTKAKRTAASFMDRVMVGKQ